MMKKVGIIGSGNVGKALSHGFLLNDYEVMIGTRDTHALLEWQVAEGANAMPGSVKEAAEFGDILVLAVKGDAALAVMEQLDVASYAGKTIIDTTNPIDNSKPPVNGVLSYFVSGSDSLMEQLQRKFPQANFVKAFNSVGSSFMVNPKFPEGKPTMFICGNNADAKKKVEEILTAFGWGTQDSGMVESARSIEALCQLWCAPGFLRNEWTHAFKLLKM